MISTINNTASTIKTPADAVAQLKEGNFRFINNMTINRDHLGQVEETKNSQSPYAAILSCMDSRTSTELIFDQGIGDVFSVRIAGNVVTDGVLGSLEYATAVVGSKLIVVMGHTNCGAIKGACDNVEMGHLTSLLHHIQPAIQMEHDIKENRTSSNPKFVETITRLNIEYSVRQILERSSIIKELVDAGVLQVVPAIYNVATGKVTFS
jgi:carbonic anhydrase